MAKKSRPYEVGLHERLRDPAHAINYVKAAAEDSREGFLMALRDVAEATKGMSELAAISSKNRENLYRMLSEEGNPRSDSLWAISEALGFRVTVEPIRPTNDANSGPSEESVSGEARAPQPSAGDHSSVIDAIDAPRGPGASIADLGSTIADIGHLFPSSFSEVLANPEVLAKLQADYSSAFENSLSPLLAYMSEQTSIGKLMNDHLIGLGNMLPSPLFNYSALLGQCATPVNSAVVPDIGPDQGRETVKGIHLAYSRPKADAKGDTLADTVAMNAYGTGPQLLKKSA